MQFTEQTSSLLMLEKHKNLQQVNKNLKYFKFYLVYYQSNKNTFLFL